MKRKQLFTGMFLMAAACVQAQSLSLDTSYAGNGSHQHSPWWNGQNQGHEIMDMVPVSNDYTLTLLKRLEFSNYTNSSEIRRQEASSGTVSSNVYYDWTIPNTEVIASAMDKITSGIVAGARIYPASGTPQVQLVKFTLDLNTTGTLDNSFGTAGVVSFPQPAGGDIEPIRILERQSDAYLYVVSRQFLTGTSNRKIVITRLNENGAIDTSFGTGGHVFHVIGDSTYAVNDALIDGNDNLYICGGSYQYEMGGEGGFVTTRRSFVTKCLPDGSIDSTYGNNGVTRFTFSDLFSQHSNSFAMKFYPFDGLVVFGSGTHQSSQRPGIAKLHDSGLLDTSFGTNGILKSHFNNYRASIADGEVMNNGTILVLGSKRANQFDPNVPCIFTLDGTGSLITSGHPDGNFTFGSEYDALVAMSKTPENKILVHGFENQDTGQGWVEYQMVSYRLNNEDSSIGIDEIKDSAMEIYPNPVTSSFRIDGTQVISVSVFDAQGSLVKQYAKSNSYDVNNLDAGMYTVVVSSNSGVRTIKMVKY